LEKRSTIQVDIPHGVLSSIFEIVSRVKKIPADTLNEDTNLVLDLHCDSLDMAEIKSVVQNDFKEASNPAI
jgi:acyl carrier protein